MYDVDRRRNLPARSTVSAALIVGLASLFAGGLTIEIGDITGPLVAGPLVVWVRPDNIAAPADNYALRFQGNGVSDIDRVKIEIHDPGTTQPSAVIDSIGETDFTIEFWMNAAAADIDSDDTDCGAGYAWIEGDIIVDHDRFNQAASWGISLLANGQLCWGQEDLGAAQGFLAGTSNVADDAWHHVAVTRDISTGVISLYVDGAREDQQTAGTGSLRYPDDGVPGNFCDGPCDNSDPFIVVGAEKHDADLVAFPPYEGLMDELRLSTTLRYTGTSYTVPSAAFSPDSDTVGLFHFDDGSGTQLTNSATVTGNPNFSPHGVLQVGGTPSGPAWVLSGAPTG